MSRPATSSYLQAGRLADVLALIQVLAYDRDTSRSEDGIKDELQRLPTTAASWLSLAAEHAEFFRVRSSEDRTPRVALIARYVKNYETQDDGDEKRPALEPDVVNRLLETAIRLHDKQVLHDQRWTTYIPLASVLLAVFALVVSASQSVTQQRNWERSYTDQQTKDRDERALQQQRILDARKVEEERESRLRDRDLFKPLWEQQIHLYIDATSAAATIATTQDAKKKADAVDRFWVLYEGPLIVVESQGISGAMKSFGNCVGKQTAAPPEQCGTDELRRRSRVLATEVLDALSKSWAQGLGGFSEGKFKYH